MTSSHRQVAPTSPTTRSPQAGRGEIRDLEIPRRRIKFAGGWSRARFCESELAGAELSRRNLGDARMCPPRSSEFVDPARRLFSAWLFASISRKRSPSSARGASEGSNERKCPLPSGDEKVLQFSPGIRRRDETRTTLLSRRGRYFRIPTRCGRREISTYWRS